MPLRVMKEEFRKFIITNHSLVMKHHERYYLRSVAGLDDKCEKIRILLINALEAAGSNPPLDAKRKCIENIMHRIKNLQDKPAFTFENLMSCFINNGQDNENIENFRNMLINDKSYPHLGNKKANLFIKELVLLAGSDIFSNFKKEKYLKRLQVPVDRVIRTIYCKMNDLKYVNNKKIDNEIQRYANELFPSQPILFDDVWFWGHFTIERNVIANINEAMIVADKYCEYKDIKYLKQKLEQFLDLIKIASLGVI